jgi:hypothetical protein
LSRQAKKYIDLRTAVEDYLSHLKASGSNPNSMFFWNGLIKWVRKELDWKKVNFRRLDVELSNVLNELIKKGKLELSLTPGNDICFVTPPH